MIDIEGELKRLPDLYKITDVDWGINITIDLTEPTMPTVSLFAYDVDNGGKSIYFERFDCPTILDGVRAAVDHVIKNLDKIKRLGRS